MIYRTDFDAVVVGSGPNGLAAAITLQEQGLSVLLLEGSDTIGGGMRTAELTLPGFQHDICSAIHPMAVVSPFMRSVPLEAHGLVLIQPDLAAAHPFDDGTAAILDRSPERTAALLGEDEKAYLNLMKPLLKDWPLIDKNVMGPLSIPSSPLAMAKFGLKGLTSAAFLSRRFSTRELKALFAGMAAHSIQPLSNTATSAIALVLLAAGHTAGWPLPRGGSQSIANALASYFTSLGGKIETGTWIKSLAQLPAARAVLFDITPKQLLQIAGHRFSPVYRWQLNRYRYGMGTFKIDWALDGPVPFTAEEARRAGTVHLGNTIEEISAGELAASKGRIPEKPFVLFAQQSLFDSTRAPSGKHTAWAYCHVPNASGADMTKAIENQVERFAPGFRDRILARHIFTPIQMEEYNPNYIGGDINGGIQDIRQLFTRPVLRSSPYRTTAKGLYICSSSTPPGGGVHGMCGYHAASRVLRDIFGLKAKVLV